MIGDSTFMHMGMQGLLDITWNRGNVTILLLDNRAVGMTGGQDNPARAATSTARRPRGWTLPSCARALGVAVSASAGRPLRAADAVQGAARGDQDREPSVIITDRPACSSATIGPPAYRVIDDKCTGCGNCIDVGCPAIHVTRRETQRQALGQGGGSGLRAHRHLRLHRLRPVRAAVRT